jgi:N-acetylmuramoyl-L-alanine amidase
MVKSTFGLLIVAVSVMAATPTVRTMYNDAFAREQAIRAALTAEEVPPALVNEIRATVARYEAVVRHYPTSSYSDNALWQAAQLSADGFAKFGQAPDKDAALRLLKQLASMYPTSKLAAQVPAQLTRLTTDTPSAPRVLEPPKPTVSDAPPLPSPAPPEKPLKIGKTEPAEKTAVTTIKEIRRTVLPDAVRVVIELDGEVEFRQDRIDGPPRVFVDLASTRATPVLVDKTLRFDGDADVVRQVRVGRHPNNTTRIVLDAAGVSSYSVYPLYGPYRLVIDCVRASGATATSGVVPVPAASTIRKPPSTIPAPVPPPAPAAASAPVPVVRRESPSLSARPNATEWLRAAPGNVPQHTMWLLEARRPSPEVVTEALSAPIPSKPAEIPKLSESTAPAKPPEASKPGDPASAPAAKNGNGGFSIARQLGLGVSRIVIDAGHGGHDPGAQGRGVVEAELVLDIALRVEKLLQKVAGVEVVLTRRTDEFVALQERTAIANREGADLFLSIHANASSSSQAHGIETYFLNFASNLSAAAVAARENAASGQAMSALPDIVKAIALNNKLDESRDFATQVQHAMIDHLRGSNKVIKDLGVKQAPFVVLIGASMPSVLAEISFVTNPQEARLLKNGNYRQRIAEALFSAIRKYQASLKSITTVAQ